MRNRLTYFLFISWVMSVWLLSPLQARELPNFTHLVEKYGPAVVNISTTSKSEENGENGVQPFEQLPGLPDDLNEFFRRFFEREQEGSPFDSYPSRSLGSGFILSQDGYIVTNNHVIEKSKEIIVRLTDRREFEAELIGSDNRSDLALLKIEATDLPTVELGTSKNLKVGEWVLAIGSPFGFDHSVTAGIVSAKGRNLPSDNYVPFIQTDVAINPGNSGGPLFDMDGKVIGVNAQIYSRTGGFMGLSFAIPVDVMKNVVEQLKEKGKVSRGWLGVLIQNVDRDLAESFNLEKPEGALVARIFPDSPAKAAGFQVGDVILSFDGKTVNSSSDLPPIVGMTEVGKEVPVKVLRQKEEVTLYATIAELPPEDDIQISMSNKGKSASSNQLGIVVTNLSKEERNRWDIEEGGVLVKKVEKGVAYEAGVRRNDVIMQINHILVENISHFKELIENIEPGKPVPVLLMRNGSPLFIALRVPENQDE